MADKITIELQLEPELSASGKKKLDKESAQAGKKAGNNFEKEFKSKTINLGSFVKTSLLNIGTALAGVAIGKTFSEGIRLAIAQEDAIKRLNNSLKITGDLTKTASQDLVDYSSELQNVSSFSDDVILNQIALAKSFGATNDQAKQIASTAIDLANALGIDLESATRNVAKTLGGYAGELGETIPELKNFTTEQLRAGAGIEVLRKRFDGAGKNLNTFSFATSQLGNSFDDALEGIGNFIIKNQALISVLKGTTGFLNDFAGGLKGIAVLAGVSDQPVNELEKIDRAIEENVDKSNKLKETLEDLKDGNIFGFVSAGDKRDIEQIPARIDALDQSLSKLIEKRKEIIATNEEVKKKRQEQADVDTEATTKEITNQQLLAQANIQTSAQITENAIGRFTALDQLRANNFISESEYKLQLLELERQTNEQFAELERQRRDRAVENARDISGATINAFKDIQVSTVQLGKDLSNLAIRGFGRSFQQIGKALASGENANQAFVDSVKNTASESASAFGDYYIKLGVTRIANGDPNGASVLAGGLGLKVLAGALGASGGGAGGAGGATAFNDQTPVLTDTTALQEQDVERTEPQTNVEVVVQGSLVQQEELGTFIAETLSDSFGKQGVSLTDARLA
jgi:hypothetical protein